MYHYQTFNGGNGFGFNSSFPSHGGHRGGGHDNAERTKDPYEVLGVGRGATQAQIKAAYRRLAMKYHPDRVRSSGDERAKDQATAKFAEISAAYELLSTGGSEGSASHPSFASSQPSASAAPAYAPDFTFGGGLASFNPGIHIDPFGFGTCGRFTDPFELFRQTFGSSNLGDFIEPTMSGQFPPFTEGPSSAAMYAPTFGGFTSFSSMMNNSGLPTQSTSASYSSSTFSSSRPGATSSRMVSTSTTIVNGKAVTTSKETVLNPDGTTTTTVSSSEGTGGGDQQQRPAIQSNNMSGRIQNVASEETVNQGRDGAATESAISSRGKRRFCNRPTVKASNMSGCNQNNGNTHPRGYKIETKQHLQDNMANTATPESHPGMPSDETYVVDLTNEDVIDLTKENDQVSQSIGSNNAETVKTKHTRTPQPETKEHQSTSKGAPQGKVCHQRSRSRKRKFCKFMSRCFFCCFPMPLKRRRINAVTDQPSSN